MMTQAMLDLATLLNAAKRIALILHVSPDGDTCGSAFALGRALALSGKEIVFVCDNKVPRIYDDLEGAKDLVMPGAVEGQVFDLAIAIDVADRSRMGDSLAVFDAARMTAQIDHHATNPSYAEVNYLRSPLSATGVLILEVIDALEVPLDLPMAKCLFVAVTTDTGNFKQQNTDEEALQLAARCIALGLDPSDVTRRVFDIRPLPQLKLMGRAFESLQLYENGRVVIMRLRKQDFEETGALPEHTEGIVNYGINTEGVEMTALLSQPIEKVRCSLRSIPPHDVSNVACALGGGGHPAASGCTLEPPMEEAIELLLGEMMKELKRDK